MFNQLSNDSKRLIYIQVSLHIGGSLVGVFLNIFLYNSLVNMTTLLLYNLVLYVFTLVFSLLSNLIAYKKNIQYVILIGILSTLVYYCLLLIFRDNVRDIIWILAIIAGAEMGILSFGFNALPYYTNEEENISKYLGIKTAIYSFIGVISPIIAGYIIYISNENIGYYILFIICLLMSILALYNVYNWKLNISVDKPKNYISLLKNRINIWNRFNKINLILGLRDSAMGFLLTIIVYETLNDELKMGALGTLSAIFGIISAYLVGKKLNKANESKITLIGTFIPLLFFAAMIYCFEPIYAIIYIVVKTSLDPLFMIPYNRMMYEILDYSSNREDFLNYMVAREIPIGIGRVIGLGIFVLIYIYIKDQILINIFVFTFSALSIFAYFGLFKSKYIIEMRSTTNEKNTICR